MRKILLSFILGIASFTAFAQSETISINVFVPEGEIPAEANKMLVTKLNQIVTNYGLADNGLTERFFLTPEILVSTKDIVPSNPPKVSQKLEIVLMIGDVEDNKLYGTFSVPVVGIGQNENKAFINAFQKIPVKSKGLESFLEDTKGKIVRYYQQNGSQIIEKAESLAVSGQYEEALQLLFSIPDCCGDISQKGNEIASRIYQSKMDREGASIYKKAKALWDTNPTESTVAEVLNMLEGVNPESASALDCEKLVARMTKEMQAKRARQQKSAEEQKVKNEEKERAEWEFKVRQYEDQLELQRQQMKDQTRIERARVETEKTVSGHIGRIDFNKVTRIIKSWTKSNK